MTYPCPCCHKPLKSHIVENGILLFCARGPCPCNKMNDGEEGETAWEAYQKLVAQYELWQESLD